MMTMTKMTMMTQTMAMMTLLMCSVAASVASLSLLDCQAKVNDRWLSVRCLSAALLQVLRPAPGHALCNSVWLPYLCLLNPLPMALLLFTTLPTPSTLSLSV